MKLALFGDVSVRNCTREKFVNKDADGLFRDVAPIMRSADLTFVNVECAITESEGEIKKFGPCLKSPTELAEVLASVGVNVCGLSNNHIFDFGIEGARDTIKALTDAGLDYTGFGENYEDSRKNYYFEKNGEKICIIAVSEHEFCGAIENRMGGRTFEYDTFGDIIDAKKHSDRVIVIYHGGKEYCRYPSPRLRSVCRAMAKCGADIVLCQHSHCIGCYEEYEGCHILYGQGNFHFIFDQYREEATTSLGVVYDTVTGKIEYIPLRERDAGIEVAKGEFRDEIVKALEERNETLKNGLWKEKWHEFAARLHPTYSDWVGKASRPESTEKDNVLFAQILKCEAHSDILFDLFHTWNDTNCIE